MLRINKWKVEGERMKNIFLFGAGASHGCGGTNHQPPLGFQLFGVLREKFPQTWGKLPESLSSKFLVNFEKGMAIVWEKYSQNTAPLMRDMAVFFSKFDIINTNANLYGKIVEKTKGKKLLRKTIFATLNYDCLFEIASSTLGAKVSYSGPDDNSAIVIKLHGSCNFIPKNIQASSDMSYTKEVSFNSELTSIQPAEIENWCCSDNALYPAMAIYTKDKPLQVGAPAIQSLQKYWQEQVSRAEKIFIIGVNPNLEDKHIWDYLSNTSSKIYFCGSQNSFINWQETAKRKDEFIESKFENAIGRILGLI